MKKIKNLLLVVFALVGMQSAYSQASVGIGVKGGLNFANVNVSQSAGQNYDNRTGYHFGAYTLFKFGKIGIQPEVLFSKQGAKGVSVNTGDFEQNYNYINIPVLLKLYTVAGINLQVGPQLGFLTAADVKQTFNGVTTTNDAKSITKNNDFSIAMGLGWDLPFGLSIDARYNLGITDINNSGSGPSAKNQVFQVSAGYRLFKLGK